MGSFGPARGVAALSVREVSKASECSTTRIAGDHCATNHRKIIERSSGASPLTVSVFFASFNLGVFQPLVLPPEPPKHPNLSDRSELAPRDILETEVSVTSAKRRFLPWKMWKSQESQQEIWFFTWYTSTNLYQPLPTSTNLYQPIPSYTPNLKTSTRPCLAAQDRWHFPEIPGAMLMAYAVDVHRHTGLTSAVEFEELPKNLELLSKEKPSSACNEWAFLRSKSH